MSEALTRRGFLQVLGTAGVASAIPTVAKDTVEPAQAAANQQSPLAPSAPRAFASQTA